MKLIATYKKLNAPLKASLWFLMCSILQKGIAFLTTPIFTRLMTEEAYGQFAVYNSWYNIFFAITTLNFAAGVYSKGLVKNSQQQEKYSSSLVGLTSLCIVVFFLIYLCFHRVINDLLGLTTFLMVLMFVEIWSNAVFQFWSTKERVNYKYLRLVIITLIYVVIRPILSIVFIINVKVEHQLEARVLAMCIVCVALFSLLFFEILKKGKSLFDKHYWIHALKFNIPLLPHYLSQIILNQSDKIMIDKMCSSKEVAYYGVAYSLAMILLVLNTSINSTMNPWIYKSIKEREFQKIGKVSYAVLVIIAICNAVVVLVGPEVLMVLAPPSYQEAVWLIPPLTTSVYFIFLYSLFAAFEYYYEKTLYVAIASVIGAGLNIVLNWIFIQKFGYLAAGYTTLICYIVFVMMHYLFMRIINKKYMNNIKIYDIRIILLLGFGLLSFATVVSFLYSCAMVRYALFTGGIVVLLCFRKKMIIFLKKYLIDKEV